MDSRLPCTQQSSPSPTCVLCFLRQPLKTCVWNPQFYRQTNMYQYFTALLSTRSCSLSLIFSPPPNAALHYAIRLNQLRLLPLVHRSDDLLCAPVVALACSLQAPPQATSQMGHSHTIRFTCLQPVRWLSPIRSLSSIRLSLPITQIYLPRSILYRQSMVYLYS